MTWHSSGRSGAPSNRLGFALSDDVAHAGQHSDATRTRATASLWGRGAGRTRSEGARACAHGTCARISEIDDGRNRKGFAPQTGSRPSNTLCALRSMCPLCALQCALCVPAAAAARTRRRCTGPPRRPEPGAVAPPTVWSCRDTGGIGRDGVILVPPWMLTGDALSKGGVWIGDRGEFRLASHSASKGPAIGRCLIRAPIANLNHGSSCVLPPLGTPASNPIARAAGLLTTPTPPPGRGLVEE
jgi:hypothetical protein